MNELPEPPVPADVDLRGYEFMPLYGDRLFGSETWISGTPEAKIAALRLWWRAYAKEVPAASLPDNDTMLAEYAGYGVAVKAWVKIRPQAMRGWVKCADGRLYHKVLADLAQSAWEERLKARAKGVVGASKRWGKNNSTGNASANATAINSDSTSNGTGNARAIASERIGEDRKGKSSAVGDNIPAHVQVATWLRAAGLKGVTADNPKVVQLAEQGVTEAQIIEATAIARTDRGKGEKQFHFSYILGIISDLQNPQERKPNGNWWATDNGIEAKGREVGMVAKPGESYQQFTERIKLKIAEVSRETKPPADGPEADLAEFFAKNGVTIDASDQMIGDWISRGITIAIAEEACELARDRQGNIPETGIPKALIAELIGKLLKREGIAA